MARIPGTTFHDDDPPKQFKLVRLEQQPDMRRLIETMFTCNAGDGWVAERLVSEDIPGGTYFVVFKDSKGQVQLIMPERIYDDWLKA